MNTELIKYLSEYVDLTDEEVATLDQPDILIKKYPKGTHLLRQGEISSKSYFVFKGCLRVYYNINGEEITTAFYTERHAITPETVINNRPSVYSLVCIEDCVLSVSTPDMEEDFFKNSQNLKAFVGLWLKKCWQTNSYLSTCIDSTHRNSDISTYSKQTLNS